MGGALFQRPFLEPQSRPVQRRFLNPKEPWALSREARIRVLIHVAWELGFSPLGSRLTWKTNSRTDAVSGDTPPSLCALLGPERALGLLPHPAAPLAPLSV